MNIKEALFKYTCRIADDSLILGQRIAEWCGHGPILEEDIALTNIALDLIGQATNLFEYAATLENDGRDSDQIAFLRLEREYMNVLLVEQKNEDFGYTMARQFYFDIFRKLFFEALQNSKDEQLAAIAEKSLKETKYHLKHSSEWVIRLGDGTEESHTRMQEAIDFMWKYTNELFFMDEVDAVLIEAGIALDLETLRADWSSYVTEILTEASLNVPTSKWQQMGGRTGVHTEHMGYILTEMQYMQRTYPGMTW